MENLASIRDTTPTRQVLVSESPHRVDTSATIKQLDQQTLQGYIDKAQEPKTKDSGSALIARWAVQNESLTGQAQTAFDLLSKGTPGDRALSEVMLEAIMMFSLDFSDKRTQKLAKEQYIIATRITNTITSNENDFHNCVDCAQNVITDYKNSRVSDSEED